jgi:hypothetical protein
MIEACKSIYLFEMVKDKQRANPQHLVRSATTRNILGRMAYKAFGKTSVKLYNAFEVFPPWDELDDGLRESWEESAVAVANWEAARQQRVAKATRHRKRSGEEATR